MNGTDTKPHVRLYAGLILIVMLIGLLVWLRVATDGVLTRMDWILFYVALALIAGIAFWSLTPGTDAEIKLPETGVRLTGGAAIGVACIWFASWLSAPAGGIVLVDLRDEDRVPNVTITDWDRSGIDEIFVRQQVSPYRVYVQFKEGVEKSWFRTESIKQPGIKVVTRYHITRSGIDDIQREQESFDESPD